MICTWKRYDGIRKGGCGIFSIYCAFEYGFLGFLIAISASVLGFLALLAAFIAIEVAEGINTRLIGILRS